MQLLPFSQTASDVTNSGSEPVSGSINIKAEQGEDSAGGALRSAFAEVFADTQDEAGALQKQAEVSPQIFEAEQFVANTSLLDATDELVSDADLLALTQQGQHSQQLEAQDVPVILTEASPISPIFSASDASKPLVGAINNLSLEVNQGPAAVGAQILAVQQVLQAQKDSQLKDGLSNVLSVKAGAEIKPDVFSTTAVLPLASSSMQSHVATSPASALELGALNLSSDFKLTEALKGPSKPMFDGVSDLGALMKKTGLATNKDLSGFTLEQSSPVLSSNPIPSPMKADGLNGETVPRFQLQMSFGHARWSETVSQQVMQLAAKNLSFAEIQLDPPELGPLQVRIQVQHDQAAVTFNAQSSLVREQLEQGQARLREVFSEEGLNLVDVDVRDQNQRDSDELDSEGMLSGVEEAEEELGSETSASTVEATLNMGVDDFV
ncbi:flagellar hook-length control protein FliK [Agaribacterium sp. ZY112]|uniref:flagellar hook-length control protein FliK n=1 Tax=Agaribacterium sp. ZY112 TaxID=3233574 RepID=UPI003525EAB9